MPQSADLRWPPLLCEVLLEAKRHGFLGPGDVQDHLRHSAGFARWVGAPDHAVDLGSGGGVPGLALAVLWPASTWTLLDSSERRTEHLRRAVSRLGLRDRVTVVTERAETFARGSARGEYDLVVARSFGPPAVTAECAAPLLHVGGRLVVAEPPGGDPARWPQSGLDHLGLRPVASVSSPIALQVLELAGTMPDAYPRRVGVPAKRPLF